MVALLTSAILGSASTIKCCYQVLDILAASLREKMNALVAPCSCVPALKMSLYAGWPASAIALAM
jgi:hypothetical protein